MTIMVVAIAIIIALCLFTVSKEFRHRCCQLRYFPGYTRWGWIIGFKLGALLQKEVKCDFEIEGEQDFLDTVFAGLVQS